ncbi:hypothetical protein [Pedobacter sp. KLB.chiD]|uniref:hypothetical protein n=1 Tax=Pedobacter sp. KLB.chiD TaxID=3387402 RepID=UPI00399B1BE4
MINNCKQATFLTEKKIVGNITPVERLQLHIHLVGCGLCRIYQQQSILINKVFTNFGNNDFKLDDDFKKRLNEKIKMEINKN